MPFIDELEEEMIKENKDELKKYNVIEKELKKCKKELSNIYVYCR